VRSALHETLGLRNLSVAGSRPPPVHVDNGVGSRGTASGGVVAGDLKECQLP